MKIIFTVFKSIFSCVWVFLKPALIVFTPILVIFLCCLFFYFYKAKKEGREVIKFAHRNVVVKPGFIERIFKLLPQRIVDNYYTIPKGKFDRHGIIVFTGAQGQGKTLACTKMLLDLQKEFPKCKVCTNYGYNFENEIIDDWHKLVDYNNGDYGVVCALDEVQNWFSCNVSKNFPPRMLATVSQNRKNKRLILCTSHFFEGIAKPIRYHTREVHACRTFFNAITIVHRKVPIFAPDGSVIKYRSLGWYFFIHSDELYSAYDTYKIIQNLSDAGFKDDSFAISQGVVSAPVKNKKRSRNSNAEFATNALIDMVQDDMFSDFKF